MATLADENHARKMDAQYRFQRYVYDFTRKYFLFGRDRLIEALDVPVGGSVLEVGVGTGRNLALVARRYPEARLFGIDISAEMLKSARRNLAKVNASERAELARADATAFDPQHLFGEAGFDRVYISYCLSMVPDWQAALTQALSAVVPGGSLHIVDFGQQERLPGWFGRPLKYGLWKYNVTPPPDLFEVAERAATAFGADVEVRSLYRDYARAVAIRR